VAVANAAAAFDILELARRRRSPVAYFSSREVYGTAAPGADGRLSEQTLGSFDHLDPRNAYPESKRMTEALMSAYQTQFGVEYHALRLASVFGPGMKLRADGRAMADLIGARLDGANLVLNSDGRAVRGYCYVSDAVRAILAIVVNGAPSGAYNIANETEPVTILELANLLAGLPLGGRTSAEVVHGQPAAAGAYSDFGYVPVNTAKLEALGWQPKVGLKAGLRRTLEAFGES
jgi:nucleoside-diphosphate-sugar epimerase